MTQQPVVQFSDRLTKALASASNSPSSAGLHGLHSHDGGLSHSHLENSGGTWTPLEHGHTHEHLEHAGGVMV